MKVLSNKHQENHPVIKILVLKKTSFFLAEQSPILSMFQSEYMSQISSNNTITQTDNPRKRRNSLMPETESIDKRNKQEKTSQEGFALHSFDLNSNLQTNEGKVLSDLVDRIISSLSVNRHCKVAEFNWNKPILLTIPMVVKQENGVEREHYFYNSKLK